MNSTIKMAMAAVLATTGLVGCADIEGGVEGDVGDVTGDVTDDIATITSAQTFTPSQCTARIISRGNEPAVRAIVGNLLSTQEFSNGAKGEYSNNASIFCNGANGDTKFVLGLIRQKYFFMGAPSPYGYPTTDELPNGFNTGRFNIFNGGNGVILWKNGASQAFEVHGGIRQVWAFLGSENGEMGFPLSDETSLSGSRKRNTFEFGRIYWTNSSAGAWPVMTTSGGNPSDKLVQLNLPRVTSASMQADQSDGGCLSISGAGFTAGRTVEFRITNPDRITQTAGFTTVTSGGTFSFTDVAPHCTVQTDIKKVNGLVTVHAVERETGKSAVGSFFTSAGTDFVGNQ